MTTEVEQMPSLNCPWTESLLFYRELERRRGSLSPERIAQAEQYHRDGFLLLKGAVPHDLIDGVLADLEPIYADPEVIAARRIQDAWTRGADHVRALATFEPVQEVLRDLYDRRPIPFQTLDFKWGSGQRAHSDSIHFSCLPARFMCGAWVALEPTTADNGPLFYYPGSHRLPEITVYDFGETVDDPHYHRYEDVQEQLMAELGIEPYELHADKGDVLIWSSNILHGGRPVLEEGSTRWSQVTHYYFEGCLYYTPIYSDIPFGEYLLKDITDLNTMERVEHTYNGLPLTTEQLANGRSRVAFERGESPALDGAALSAEVAGLQAELAWTRQELADLRTSESFRLGNAAVQPLVKLRGYLGQSGGSAR
jgi:hypothetical protein